MSSNTLDNTSRALHALFCYAWDKFEAHQAEEANAMCRRLLLEPRLSPLGWAGCHLVLAHSPDQSVEHAQAALEAYQNLFSDEPALTELHLQSQKQLIELTERVLAERQQIDAEYSLQLDEMGEADEMEEDTEEEEEDDTDEEEEGDMEDDDEEDVGGVIELFGDQTQRTADAPEVADTHASDVQTAALRSSLLALPLTSGLPTPAGSKRPSRHPTDTDNK
ncbi:hypothetical protein P153DRAFT_380607 [Dothidotthia symphoricarpi CBS 119687]|uniref:Uncharacterized protein n=1 Tax=Dothidotthia symphoricarpi CBS 119687 TaxID=1392245 RepID=A0A6A6AV00_9PLEO|nr:uncharacterized protein P153DRAFT_380607 [Dothidotthia symphoricarpi CBS 119687]KAF2134795.1 hypothetical protein P153DRAFT_380607 [Dothidotthia symphoricarpi CBS 119687]